jgi:ribosomal protein L37E
MTTKTSTKTVAAKTTTRKARKTVVQAIMFKMEDETMKDLKAAESAKRNASKPVRKTGKATVMTRDMNTERKIKCPECGGMNGMVRLNQTCDHCGFMLSVRLFPDHEHYVRGLGVTTSGRDTYDIGDSTADDLRGLTVDLVIEKTAALLAGMDITEGLSVKLNKQFKKSGYNWSSTSIAQWLSDRYEGRNDGMVRMNCGNILRAARKRESGENFA